MNDPDKTRPPMPRISFQELMDKFDDVIAPGLLVGFAEELLQQLNDPSQWVATGFMKLDARPYEEAKR